MRFLRGHFATWSPPRGAGHHLLVARARGARAHFTERVNVGDLDGAMATYTEDVVHCDIRRTGVGEVVGREAMRNVLESIFAVHPRRAPRHRAPRRSRGRAPRPARLDRRARRAQRRRGDGEIVFWVWSVVRHGRTAISVLYDDEARRAPRSRRVTSGPLAAEGTAPHRVRMRLADGVRACPSSTGSSASAPSSTAATWTRSPGEFAEDFRHEDHRAGMRHVVKGARENARNWKIGFTAVPDLAIDVLVLRRRRADAALRGRVLQPVAGVHHRA